MMVPPIDYGNPHRKARNPLCSREPAEPRSHDDNVLLLSAIHFFRLIE
jgi:hypothetical protein